MGNCHPSKTNVNLGFASVYIQFGFHGVTIFHVTLSCSQYLYNNDRVDRNILHHDIFSTTNLFGFNTTYKHKNYKKNQSKKQINTQTIKNTFSTESYRSQLQSDHLATFRRAQWKWLCTRQIGTTFWVTWTTNTYGARILFKRAERKKWRGRGENFGKIACSFRQTLHLVVHNIKLEMPQVYDDYQLS